MIAKIFAPKRSQLTRAVRRNRVLVIALLTVGALVALLNGIGAATFGNWRAHHTGFDGSLPANRFGAASAYERVNNELLMFGGFVAGPLVATVSGVTVSGTPVATHETWGQGMQRKQQWTNRNPVNHPSARGYASLAFDVASKNMVLFGGAPYRSNAVSGETWTYDGIDWTLREPPGLRPPARQNASMVYDRHRRVVVMFGGRDANNAPLNDTWIWEDGSAWKKLTPSLSPSPRHSAAMGYDQCRGQAVMFGGTPGGNGTTTSDAPGETWIWNGTTWTLKSPVPSPSRRIGASMLYSHTSGRVLMYGGLFVTHNNRATAAVDENVWTWDGTTWRKETVDPVGLAVQGLGDSHEHSAPAPRAYAHFAYDGSTERSGNTISLFGGTPGDPDPAPQVFNNDHHHLDETSDIAQTAAITGTGCVIPVPLPPEETAADKSTTVAPLRKITTRPEIQEIGRLPVLLGTDRYTLPAGAPAPDCWRRGYGVTNPSNRYESVGNTHLVTDPKRHQVYQFFICVPPQVTSGQTGQQRILIQTYDAKTLKPLKSAIAIIPFQSSPPTWQWAKLWHDTAGGRFLLPTSQGLFAIHQNLIEKGVDPVGKKYTPPAGAFGDQFTEIEMGSLFNHPVTGLTKLIYGVAGSNQASFLTVNSNPSSTPPKLIQLDLESNLKDWEVSLADCIPTSIPAKGYRAKDAVYTTCPTGESPTAGNGVYQYGVVKIPVAEGANGSDILEAPKTFPGPAAMTKTWFDPQACRMLLLSENIFIGSSLWIFDCESSRYVGSAGMGRPIGGEGSGFDPESGRFYVLLKDYKSTQTSVATNVAVQQGGLFVVDTRLTPVPQPVNFGQFSYTSSAQIGILPPSSGLPTRLFMRRGSGSTPSDPNDPNQVNNTADVVQRYTDGENVKLADEMYYKVLADSYPVPEQPRFDQQDALTIPVAPSEKTQVSYDAEGSGYGMRFRRVGGLFTFSGSTDPPCAHPDREVMAGWVANAHLSDIEVSARSLGLDLDSSSEFDLQSPASRCMAPKEALAASGSGGPAKTGYEDALYPFSITTFPQVEDQTGPQVVWNKRFEEVECTGDISRTTQTVAADVYGSAKCDQKLARVEGGARGSVLGLDAAGFSVGESSSKVVVTRDPVKGIVVTSTAWATGIKLGPLTIERVETKAVSWSNGRPHEEPRGEFSRLICGFHTPDGSIPGCLTSQQQKDNFARWNSGWGARSQITIPTPDQTLLQGTPGGYTAGVAKSLAEEEEEKLFLRDVQREVVGLRIMFTFNHFNAPEKHFLDLAAVRAITSFGVQCESDYIYSPSAKDCVVLTFEDEFPQDEPVFEEEPSSEDGSLELYAGGGGTPIETTGAPEGLALGQRIGRFVETLPIIGQLPIRQMGEALLAWSVWLVLGLPLFLAWRRAVYTLGISR